MDDDRNTLYLIETNLYLHCESETLATIDDINLLLAYANWLVVLNDVADMCHFADNEAYIEITDEYVVDTLADDQDAEALSGLHHRIYSYSGGLKRDHETDFKYLEKVKETFKEDMGFDLTDFLDILSYFSNSFSETIVKKIGNNVFRAPMKELLRDFLEQMNNVITEEDAATLFNYLVVSSQNLKTENDPVMRSFPELLDVGIMGHCNGGQYCRNAGIDCYQKGFTTYAPHMSYENFMEIVKQAAGKTFQIALGGAGDPNKHPQIEDILKSCRAYRIIPNMTTSGFLITDNEVGLIKQYCGAVAVSWYSRFMDGKESNQETIDAVERLVKSGCTTNIHYVVSKDTINEAITRLEMDSFPKGVNAVIFILYKPVGNGIIEKVLKNTDSRIERFISLATKVKHPYRVGFDTCFTPALLRWGDTVPAVSIDACEAATFSMYIDSQMNCYPCSFGIWDKSISESMNSKTLREIWQGDKFVAFREQRKEKCSSCRQMELCRGGCRLGIDIDMC